MGQPRDKLKYMQADKYFKKSSIFFHEGRWQQALLSVNQYLQIRPGNSLAYSNRALIHFYLANHPLARDDIHTALQLNPLNYIACYNLFSICAREKQPLAALKALQMAIAAMCLIKGRLAKDLASVRRSLELTDNNFDALILYLLLNVQAQDYAQGLRVIEAAEKSQQGNGFLWKLRAYIRELLHNYSYDTEEALYDYLLQVTPAQQKLVLNQKQLNCLIEEEINAKIAVFLAQFNQLYGYLNARAGGGSYLIAKTGERKEAFYTRPANQEKELVRKEMIKSN